MSKTKNLKRSNFGQSVFLQVRRLERKMCSAAKGVEQSLRYWYLSKMEWVSLHRKFVPNTSMLSNIAPDIVPNIMLDVVPDVVPMSYPIL